MTPEPLPIELLIDEDKRRLNVALSASQPIDPCPWCSFDPLLADRPPQTRSSKKINSVLSILDELERRNPK